jgi:hypothetical protein
MKSKIEKITALCALFILLVFLFFVFVFLLLFFVRDNVDHWLPDVVQTSATHWARNIYTTMITPSIRH